MSSILEELQRALGSEGIRELSTRIGANENSTAQAVSAALPTLLGAFSRQAATPQQAGGLLQMLDRDGDGNILNDISGFLGQAQSLSSGGGILEQILGQRQTNVQQGISKASGLPTDSVSQLLKLLAPIVMGAITKQVKSQRMDGPGLMEHLKKEHQSADMQLGGVIGKFLDQDGDGDFDFGDVAKLAMGKIFGGQSQP